MAIIPKPGREDYTLPSSYRPISLLPTLGKLYEKVVNRRLQHLADVHSWFSPSQHGFVSGKSTISALNSFVDSIQQGFSLRAYTGCVLLDIQGAFDHACHANLVIALNNKGCPSNLVNLELPYKSERCLSSAWCNSDNPSDKGLPPGEHPISTSLECLRG